MKIIIAGAGAVGTHLARLMSRDHEDCTLVDEDAERLEGLDSEYDIMTMEGSPTSIKTLKEAGAEDADIFVAVTPDESRNMTSCIMAHAIGAKKTVARIDNYEYLSPKMGSFFRNIGIDSLIYPEVLAAIDINNGLKMSWVRQRWDVHGGALVMLGIKLRATCEILNRPLRELCGPDDPYHIVAAERPRLLHDYQGIHTVYQEDSGQGAICRRQKRNNNGGRQDFRQGGTDCPQIP